MRLFYAIHSVALIVCINSERDKACFESLVGNHLEVMISLIYIALNYMRRLYPTGLLCQTYCVY